jgi:hypothetical protein
MACYKRQYKTGAFPKREKTQEERFWAMVDRSGGPGACWPWTGFRMANGYAQFGLGGRTAGLMLVHRFAYQLTHGSIPKGLTIDHLCRTRACVNVAHLEAVTQQVNNHRSPDTRFRVNGAKTHCPRGHPYDEANTIVRKDKRNRLCRECGRAASRRYYTRKKMAGTDTISHV